MRTETLIRHDGYEYTNILRTLRELVEEEMLQRGDDIYDIVGVCFDNTDLNKEYRINEDFPCLFYGAGIDAWYIWTFSWLYLHRYYDGESNVVSVPRHPRNIVPDWIGDG